MIRRAYQELGTFNRTFKELKLAVHVLETAPIYASFNRTFKELKYKM